MADTHHHQHLPEHAEDGKATSGIGVRRLSEDESTWLENQLSEVAAERHRSSERSFVAADLADRVLENLSADDRVVLTLIDGEDASVKEVAELTGWSESKVKVQAFRARRRMRAAVEKLLGSRPTLSEAK